MTTTTPENRAKVMREMVARDVFGRKLSRASGVGEATISTALNGRPIRSSTLRRLAEALAAFPVVTGTSGVKLRLRLENENASVQDNTEARKEGNQSAHRKAYFNP